MRWLTSLILGLALTVAVRGEGSKATFRDDHMVSVNGQPFFPIGLYYCTEEFEDPTGKLLKELKEFGFNTLGYYRWGTPKWREELDRAHQHGLKVWIRGHNGFAIDSADIAKTCVEQVRKTRSHPALLFWEFQDEPILNKVSIEASRKGYQLVHREDPDHPMLVVEWPGAMDRLHLWKGIGDIFATDLYPIPRQRKYGRLPNHDITQMRDYIKAIRQAHQDKPVLLVLQAWAWEPLKDGEKGYPTRHESRFMAYQAVIHGASGIHYYGQFHCTRPNSAAALYSEAKDPAVNKAEFEQCLELNRRFWERHRPFFKELSRASRMFVLPKAKATERIELVDEAPRGTTGIESMTKQAGGELYLLSVNADSKDRVASFRLPTTARTAEIHVLFENRKLAVKEGTFTDRFKPYDTHVYATTPELPR